MADARSYALWGACFQLPMIAMFIFRSQWFWPKEFEFGLPFVFGMFGLVIMLTSLLRIYTSKQLIVTDIFALTRHPMYHGMFLADVVFFFFNENYVSVLCWVTWVLFFGCMLAAGWFQEQETLARWGKEAKVYYAKTPRFIFGNLGFAK